MTRALRFGAAVVLGLVSAAIAVPMGARTVAWSGGAPTARDYIQDGLVAMWDGIENAGWGVHDASAAEWRDLAGNYPNQDLVISEGSSWAANHYVSGQARRYPGQLNLLCESKYPITGAYAPLTIEYVSSYGGGAGEAQFFGIYPSKDNYQTGSTSSGWWGRLHNASANTGWTPDVGPMSCILTYDKASYTTTYYSIQEGVLTLRGEGSWQAWYQLSGHSMTFVTAKNVDVYAIRVYSRVLTAAEIAHNYAVDKARFGLP